MVVPRESLSTRPGLIAGVLVMLAGACAPKTRPPPLLPPAPAPTPPSPPPVVGPPPWAPSIDLRAVKELARLDACAEEHIDAFNDLPSEGEEGAGDHLVAALECFERGGRSAKSIRVIKVLLERFPDVVDEDDLRYRLWNHYRTLVHDRLDTRTVAGRACGASPFDPPSRATAEAILEIAECLEDQDMFGAPLRYRRLAAERGAGPDNDQRIEELAVMVEKLQQALLAQ